MNRDELVRTAMTLDDQLDDIKRAQIWTRLEREIDTPAPRAMPWRSVLAVGACAAAAVVCWVVLRRGAEPQMLVAPEASTLTAHIGPHTQAQLVGPARLEILGTPGDATHVRLREGTLVAEFTGGPGRSLRIEAPEAVIEIVGTLFAVEIGRDGTCVSVAHGTVAVTAGGGKHAVTTGERWCTGGQPIEALPPAMRERFEQFSAIEVATRAGSAATPSPDLAPTVATRDEPSHVESTATVATPVEPARIEPARIEPARIEPARVEPARVEPARVEPGSTEPPLVESTPTTPARIESASNGSADGDPPPVESAPTTPARVDSVPTTPARVTAAPPTAESLYQSAEAALAKRDLAAADRALATLVASFADSALVDQAIYERARIAYQRHAWSDARHQLEKLAENRSTPLAEPGAYLACRIAVETHDDAAARCLTEYRASYPSSPHDLEVLGLLVGLAYREGGCARAASAIDELGRRYPRAQLARSWRTRCEVPR